MVKTEKARQVYKLPTGLVSYASGRPERFFRSEAQLRFSRDLQRDDLHGFLHGLFELHSAIAQSKEREIAAAADVFTGVELSAALADDDAAGGDKFACIGFHAEHFRLTVTTVTAAGLTFLMCHFPSPIMLVVVIFAISKLITADS